MASLIKNSEAISKLEFFEKLISVFQKDNPRFNKAKFLKASGLIVYSEGDILKTIQKNYISVPKLTNLKVSLKNYQNSRLKR